MGRPREHDEATAAALLDAAERIIQHDGLEELSIRGLADETGTTTRAVYSLFGSKEGLLVALAAHGFDILGERVRSLPRTSRPDADLVNAGVNGFRPFALAHPALFSLGVQRRLPDPSTAALFADRAALAFSALLERVQRVKDAGLLGNRDVRDVAVEFHSLCEGLASVELRTSPLMVTGQGERLWRDAMTAMVAGYATTKAPRRTRPTARAGTPDN